MHSRRQFIKTTGISSLGMGLLPSLASFGPMDISDTYSLPRALPETQGVSSEAIRKFVAAANASGIGWHSFMLLRHGNVIAEGWWKPFAANYRHTLYSLSKSFTSTAIGLLVKEGKLDIDTALTSFFPDEVPASHDDNLSKMKVRHLLTMNTGHAEDTMPKLRASQAPWTTTFLAQPVAFEPGSHFLYNTGATYMLGAIVHKITGQTLEAYLAPRLFEPLQITGYDWEKSPQGLNTAGYGLRVKTEDIARFGQMYLQKGQWKGKQILTSAWVDAATSYQTKSQEGNGDWSAGYGYQFWRCKPGFFRGDGAFGQFCIVMLEQDAVMAVTSESWNMQQSMTTIWDNLLPAFQTAKLPSNSIAHAALLGDLKALTLPVPKGSRQPSVTAKYNRKIFSMDGNDTGVSSLSFSFSENGCYLNLVTDKGARTLGYGWENWITDNNSAVYAFPVAGRIHVPSRMAGTATWTDARTLQLNARFVEAMHGDTITCVFDGDKVTMSFLNSVSEHNKTDTEKRTPITGKLG